LTQARRPQEQGSGARTNEPGSRKTWEKNERGGKGKCGTGLVKYENG